MNTLVKALMVLRGVNQSELSKKSGVSMTAISRFLNEESQLRSDAFLKILASLGADLDTVLKVEIKRALSNSDDYSPADDIKILLDKATPKARNTILDAIISSFNNDESVDTRSRLQRIKKYHDSINAINRL